MLFLFLQKRIIMSIKKHIPNFITLLNLFAGCIAVFYAVLGHLEMSALFVILGIVFDFFDGFVARLLNVQGELGKQLDSMADMVTSGLVPGMILFQLLLRASTNTPLIEVFHPKTIEFLPFIGLVVTLASAYRLANFNIDSRQTSSFIGLPTPANTLLIISLPLIITYSDINFIVSLLHNPFILIVICGLSSYLLNAEIPLFALKFKNFTWKDNSYKYVFVAFSVIVLFGLKFAAIPVIIFSYILFSIWQASKNNN